MTENRVTKPIAGTSDGTSSRAAGRSMSVRVLDCQYAGAVAWGVHYPSPGRVVTHAKNGSAPGYVRKKEATR